MKNKSIALILSLCISGLAITSCDRITNTNDGKTVKQELTPNRVISEPVVLQDYGPEPTVLNIEDYTSSNTNFRTTLWTGKHLQVTLMAIPVGGEVGLEQHMDIDQFLRIEEGQGRVMMGDSRDSLTFTQVAEEDFAIFVPAGKWHNIINTGDEVLKLYSIYSPAEHPHGTVHQTMQEAMEAEHAH